METITMPKNFNTDNITYVGPKVNKYKAKSVYINYNKNPLILKTPTMRCPFGVGANNWEGSDYTKYTLDCSFDNMDTNTDIKTFYDALTTLDTKLIDDGCKNSLAWFTKKKLSHEVVTEFYRPNVVYSTDRETGEINTAYPPRFKVKIPVRYGRVDCKVWRDLAWDLTGWDSSSLDLLSTNDLQLEAEYRGIEVDTTLEEEELRETTVASLLEWSSSSTEDERTERLSSLTTDDNVRMYNSKKSSRPVQLELKPEDLDGMQRKPLSVSLLVKCRSMWFTGGKFGCSWEVLHMKIHPLVDATPTLTAEEIDMDNVSFTEPRVNKYGGKSVSLKYNDNQLRLKFPKMPLPFGVSKYTPEGSDTSKYTLDVSFRDKESDESVRALHDFFTELDTKMISSACENSLAWFTKKKMTPEVVEAILKPSLRYSTDRETGEPLTQYAPRFSVRLPFYGGDAGFKVYDEDGDLIEDGLESLKKGSSVELTARCSSLWLGSGRFGLTWDVTKITVYPGETLDSYPGFDDDPDDVVATIISDSEEEEEEEVEEEEEEVEEEEEDDLEVKPPTPPPAKKRRGRKKKVVAEA